jgi:hypothetical protein
VCRGAYVEGAIDPGQQLRAAHGFCFGFLHLNYIVSRVAISWSSVIGGYNGMVIGGYNGMATSFGSRADLE